MADYISRDDFAKHLSDIQYGEAPTGRTGENIDYKNGVYAGFDMAYVALKQFPAADVRPVVKGHWIVDKAFDGCQLLQCDQCKSMMWNHEEATPNFCHNCGADMREKVTR